MWYDGDIDERAVRRSWSMLGAALCGQWNVFAVDLQNEPHAALRARTMCSGVDRLQPCMHMLQPCVYRLQPYVYRLQPYVCRL